MENEFVYRRLAEHEITLGLFSAFERRQVVTKCWRKNGGQWQIQEDPFVDQWDTADYAELVRCLRNTVRTGGVVYGAFGGGVLKGFVSVEAEPLELQGNYLDLTSRMFQRTAAAPARVPPFSVWRPPGQRRRGRKSFIFPPIRRLRPRRSTGGSAVGMLCSVMPGIRRQSPLTVSWNLIWRRFYETCVYLSVERAAKAALFLYANLI